MDSYVIRRIEAHAHNPYVRLLARSGLNPTRSLANMIAARVPWHRDTRPGVWETPRPLSPPLPSLTQLLPALAPFEFLATTRVEEYFGQASRGACIGGGGAASFRIGTHWQVVGDIAGLFRDTAEGEAGHAHGHLDQLRKVGDPITDKPIGPTDANLEAAIAGETSEYTSLYPQMAATAREEGIPELADWFDRLAKAEHNHADRFRRGLDSLRSVRRS
jgi:Rubrerythrin